MHAVCSLGWQMVQQNRQIPRLFPPKAHMGKGGSISSPFLSCASHDPFTRCRGVWPKLDFSNQELSSPPPVSPYPAATQTAKPQKCGCRQGARCLCASPHEEVKAGKLLTGLSSGVPAWLWVLVDACPEPATSSSPLFLDRATVPLKEHFDSLWKELGSFHGPGERLIFETRLHWPRDLRTWIPIWIWWQRYFQLRPFNLLVLYRCG